MSTVEPVPTIQRGWLTLAQLPLMLPYLTVTRCQESTPSDLTGVELYFSRDFGPLGFGLAVLLLVLWVFVWRGERDGTVPITAGLRAFVAGFGSLVVVAGPALAFLFDETEPKIGWWAHGIAWGLTAAGYLLLGLLAIVLEWGERADPPGPRSYLESGLTILLGIITPVAVMVNPFFNDTVMEDVPFLLAAGWVVSLPLALTGVGLARARRDGLAVQGYRILWWAASIVTVIAHVAAAFAD